MASSSSRFSSRSLTGSSLNKDEAPKWQRYDVEEGDVAPEGRIGHTLCTNTEENIVILYGGVTDNEDGTSRYLDDLFMYNFETKKWISCEISGQRQQPRAFHTAVFWHDKMWIFGGCNGRGRFNRLFSVTLDGVIESSDLTTLPPTRYCHTATLFEGCMYVFGGKCGGRNSNKRLDDLWVFNFEERLWSQVVQNGTKPSPRSAHAAATYGRNMIVFGGRSEQGECCEDLHFFNHDTQTWRRVVTSESLFGRARHSFVLHNSTIIVFGGWNGRRKLSDLFYYHIDSECFEVVGDTDESGPSRRECHVAVMCKNTMVVFGGRFRNDFMNNVSELVLGAKQLKEFCRDWLVLRATPALTVKSIPRAAIPSRLMLFLASFSELNVRVQQPDFAQRQLLEQLQRQQQLQLQHQEEQIRQQRRQLLQQQQEQHQQQHE